MPNFLQAKQGKLGVAASLVRRKPPGSLTWLRTLCRSTFIQYSCFSRSAVFYIPTIKQKLRLVFPDLFTVSDGSLEVGQPSHQPRRLGRLQTGLYWMHESSHPQNMAEGHPGASGGGRTYSYACICEEDFMALRSCCWSCPDCRPAVFPLRPPIMRLVSFSEEVQACARRRLSCAAHGCF